MQKLLLVLCFFISFFQSSICSGQTRIFRAELEGSYFFGKFSPRKPSKILVVIDYTLGQMTVHTSPVQKYFFVHHDGMRIDEVSGQSYSSSIWIDLSGKSFTMNKYYNTDGYDLWLWVHESKDMAKCYALRLVN